MRRLRWAAREVWWWLSRLARIVRRRPLQLVLWLVAVLVVFVWAGRSAAAVVLLPPVIVMLLTGVWARWWPVAFHRFVTFPGWRRSTRRQLVRSWPTVMDGCGLSRPGPVRSGTAAAGTPMWTAGSRVAPLLGAVRWDAQGLLHVSPRLLVGQTVDDLEDAAERLRTAMGANRLRVVPNHARTAAEVVCTFGDPLQLPFLATVPDPAAVAPAQLAEEVVLGRTEDGTPWKVRLRVSTLVAGCSDAGKGSVMWSLMLALAPAIRAGLVEVHGIDLKGGMELALGKSMFTRYADRVEHAAVLLEDAVHACEERAAQMAGLSRLHSATTVAPLVLVLVDELASLTCYVPDRDLLKRAEVALGRLCSIGRAPGFFVWGFLQDPRKETIKSRHLFGQTIGLRLREREEVAMILGDGAIAAGAACHKISRATPGLGYALDDTGLLVRVRAGKVDDDAIRTVAAAFSAPRVIPVELPADDEPARPIRNRRPRPRAGDTKVDDVA